MTVFTSCNICGSDKYHEICDVEISPILIPSKLVKCKECSFFYANPILEEEAEKEYYEKRYHEIQQESIDIKDYWYKGRVDIFKRSLCEISKFLKKGRLIDIGCGMGYFMDLARSEGWEVKGVEISDYAIDYARGKLKLDVFKGDLKEAQFEAEYFDIAVMLNVLDQIYNPRATLIELNRILKKGGYVFIRVSNLYFQLKLFRLYNRLKPLFKNINPSVFHLYSFDNNSIRRLLESTGFSKAIVKTSPSAINENYLCITRAYSERRKKVMDKVIRRVLQLGVKAVYFLSLGKIIISPSIFIIAKKRV